MYELKKATSKDIPLIEQYKLKTFINLPKEEEKRVEKYVHNTIPQYIQDYKLIIVDKKIIGCLLYYSYLDGVLIDEIYIGESYRNKGIGTKIIMHIIANYDTYLWVYKDNKKAISLYKKLGFRIIKHTQTRYFMKKN